MKHLLFAAIFLTGCFGMHLGGPHMTLMVNPKTGERITCRPAMHPAGIAINQGPRETCVNQYTALGFIEAEKLTAEQREAITSKVPR